MMQVPLALRHMRERLIPSLAASFRTETDAVSQVPAAVTSVLSVDIEASETSANVPYRLTEEITVSNDAKGIVLTSVVNTIESAVNGKTWFDDSGTTIAGHRRVRTSYSPEPGLVRSATIEWAGECSWL